MFQELIWPSIYFIFFAIFHSVTSHEIFKSFLSRVVGSFFVEHFWRLIYCVASFAVLNYLVLVPLRSPQFTEVLYFYPIWVFNILAILYLFGLFIIYAAFIQVNYFEFWGVQQAYYGIRYLLTKRPPPKMEIAGVDRLVVKGIYHVVRHPMLAGGFMMVISSPLTVATILYSTFIFIYMLVGVYFEERRLHQNIGPDYARYCKEVGAFFPKPRQLIRFFALDLFLTRPDNK